MMLICICKEASSSNCASCPKGNSIKPNLKGQVDTWPKVINGFSKIAEEIHDEVDSNEFRDDFYS